MTDPMELVGRLESYRSTNEWGDPVHHAIIDEAAACIREMVEWRPIETAPTSVEFRCLLGHEFSVVTGYWDGSKWVNERSYHPHHGFPATHWLPLPPAPGAEDE